MENGRNLEELIGWLGREDTGLCIENSSRHHVVLTAPAYKEQKIILASIVRADCLEEEESELDLKVWMEVR